MITGVLFKERERGGMNKKEEMERKGKASVVRRAGILFVPTSKAAHSHPMLSIMSNLKYHACL